jgi:hypothetical protein
MAGPGCHPEPVRLIKIAEDEISKNEIRGSHVYPEDERDSFVSKDSVSFRSYSVMTAEF